jgi:hypothetical protein
MTTGHVTRDAFITRARDGRVIAALAAILLVALLLVANSHRHTVETGRCSLSSRLVPSCGVLLGVTLASPKGPPLTALESAVRRKFDLVYAFHGIDHPELTAEERAATDGGRVLHLNVEAREFGVPGHPPVRWSEITAGRWDEPLRRLAAELASLDRPVFLTFDHEVDSAKKLDVRGTAGEYVAAWRHLHRLFAEVGAKKVVWVWVVTGSNRNWSRVPDVYPGNSYVDWLSWDPYNSSGCRDRAVNPSEWRSFKATVQPFYEWLQTNGKAAGIDIGKPYMLSEFGTVSDPDDPTAAARWYDAIPGALKTFPKLKALTLWNSAQAACDYRIDPSAQTLHAFAQMSHSSVFTRAATALAAAGSGKQQSR